MARAAAALAALAAPLLCGGQLTPPDNESARYECNTITCGLHDVWERAENLSDDISPKCAEAQEAAMAGFGTTAPQMCRSKMSGLWPEPWGECKVQYCQMYEDLLHGIMDGDGPGYWGGEECEPLLLFNKTLCETKHRDAEAFCSCFCPTMLLLEDGDVCDKQIMSWLLLGRRGGLLEQRNFITEFCSERLCRFIEKVGHPTPPNSLLNSSVPVPGMCRGLDLPWRHGHCKALLTNVPYEAEPWKQPMEENDTFMCSDRTVHTVDSTNIDTLDVCLERDDRWRCPANMPTMCSERKCVAKMDFCCEESVEFCSSGEERQCSPALCSTLPEWSGMLTPDDYARAFSSPAPAAAGPQPASEGETMTVKWISTLTLILLLTVAGLVASVAGCFFVGKKHYNAVTRVFVGPQRALGLMMQEPRKIGPTFTHKTSKPHFPLKPKRPQHEIDAENVDRAAAETLHAAMRAMEDSAMRTIASAEGAHGPSRVERQVEEALDLVMERGLHVRDDLAPLYERGERFLLAKASERRLGEAVDEAVYELGNIREACGANKLDIASHQQHWLVAERLKAALDEATEDDGSEAQRARAAKTLRELVAKVPQLPANQVVPDPRGGGLLLLPAGHRTIIDHKTGDMRVEVVDAEDEASKTVEVPRRELLGEVGIEDARPVCAQYVREGRCKQGRRCPWRHCKPQKGDAIRESFVWDDD